MAKRLHNAKSIVLALLPILLVASAPLVAMSLPSVYAGAEEASDTSSEEFTCADKVAPEENKIESNLDKSKAKTIASADDEVKSQKKGYQSVFNSVFTTWSYDPITCGNLTLDTVNVVNSLYNGTEYVKNLVVTLDPSMSKVIAVSEHVGEKNSQTIPSTTWSGYEFYGNSGHTVDVLEAKGTFKAPTVTEPVAFWCNNEPCIVTVWTGLTEVAGGSPSALAQGGTLSKISCPAGCTTEYYGWYEFLPAQLVKCLDVRANDSVTATTTNNAKTGGSNTSITIKVFNNTLGKNCSTTQTYSAMDHPRYGQFILERPRDASGNPLRLPKFTTETFSSDTIYYSGSSKSISTPYGSGWFNKYIMNNGQGNNVSVGSVSSGSFTITWLKSDGAT